MVVSYPCNVATRTIIHCYLAANCCFLIIVVITRISYLVCQLATTNCTKFLQISNSIASMKMWLPPWEASMHISILDTNGCKSLVQLCISIFNPLHQMLLDYLAVHVNAFNFYNITIRGYSYQLVASSQLWSYKTSHFSLTKMCMQTWKVRWSLYINILTSNYSQLAIVANQ